MASDIATLSKYWKYSEAEIQACLIRTWRSAFLNGEPLPEEISMVLYPILVQNEASKQFHGLTVEILLLSEILPLTFSNNFSGHFYSYVRSGSFDCLRLLLCLENSEHLLIAKNVPLLVDDLVQLSTHDESDDVKSTNYPIVPAVAHCLKHSPNVITSSNRRSITTAVERLLLKNIGALVNHRVQLMEMHHPDQAVQDYVHSSELSLGMVVGLIKSLINHISIPCTLVAIFYKFVTTILDNEDEEAVSLLKESRTAILIDIVQVLEKIAIGFPEESARVLAFLSEICMRFDENVSLATFGALLSVKGTLNSSAIERLTKIVCCSYMDPLIAHGIVKFVDNHFNQLEELRWIDQWFPVMFKLACARPMCYTKYIIRWISVRSKRTSSILISILNLPSICSTVEFSQLMEVDANLKQTFRKAVGNDPDVLRAYTTLLRNSYDSGECETMSELPWRAVAEKSRMWLRPSFRVSSVCSTLVPLVNAFFESEFMLGGQLKTSVSIAIDHCFAWLTEDIQSMVSEWVLKALERFPRLIVELQDSIRDFISNHLSSDEQVFLSTMIYCIGEYGMRCPEHESFIADYIDFLEEVIVQLLNNLGGQKSEFAVVPPWGPCVPGKRCTLEQTVPASEQSDASKFQSLLCMSLTALAKLSIVLPNRRIHAFRLVQDDVRFAGTLVEECLQEAKLLAKMEEEPGIPGSNCESGLIGEF